MSKLSESPLVNIIKTLFIEVDVNHNGKLDETEFGQAMTQLGLAKEELESVWKSVDTSGDGELEWSEFLAACVSLPLEQLDSSAEIVYKMMDKDSNRAIEFKEFKNFLVSHKFNIEDNDIRKEFNQIDMNENNTLEWEEFKCKFYSVFNQKYDPRYN
eukprot:CAMPEP_0116927222 /NCGR_PEP_ID=MMETSP0467-20121206/25212_1 /TAXON_ID=283647 /ORGANISM="Mesodinium pulex, Strain SPMC105" /LENGTH=156 /DNA_ID=CAMNT_0004606669 /DNA_START=922 /DNA_END=1392 /DNA_ORIENTATION=+